jgi:hypothetical protein
MPDPASGLIESIREPAVVQATVPATWTLTDRNLGRWACYVFFALSLAYVPAIGAGFLANGNVDIASWDLCLAGLLGAAMGNMEVRNIGIVGYALVLPAAILVLTRLFSVSPLARTDP